MEPTKALSQDHRVIERVLNSLEVAARRLQDGTPVRAAYFLEVADFIGGFADGCHHRKEEEHLFPALEEAGFPRHGGPVGVMLAEHEEGRRYTAGLRTAAQRLAAGDSSAAETVVECAQNYIGLLRQHILKEDNVLFMMAQRALSPEKQAQLMEAFEQVEREHGDHAKWTAVVEALEREVVA